MIFQLRRLVTTRWSFDIKKVFKSSKADLENVRSVAYKALKGLEI